MRKLFLSMTIFAIVLGAAAAYNPPVQGENLFFLSHPELLTGGNSVAGDGIQSIMPATGTINPALIGMEERVTLDFGYTGMINSRNSGFSNMYSQAFGAGIIVPTDWVNIGGELEFILDENCMGLGDSFHIKAMASKQILDKLYIGVSMGFGYEWKMIDDWMLTADVGAVYKIGDLGFLKNLRIAASANNLGKTLNTSHDWQGYPGMFAIKAGAAAELVNVEKFILGLSLDVTTPLFTNCILDSGLQMRICDFVQINTSWQFNFKEFFDGNNSWLPTVGLIFKIPIGMGKSEFVKKNDWSSSELSPSVGWKNVDWDVNLFSAGAVLRLGQLDNSGPDIEME